MYKSVCLCVCVVSKRAPVSLLHRTEIKEEEEEVEARKMQWKGKNCHNWYLFNMWNSFSHVCFVFCIQHGVMANDSAAGFAFYSICVKFLHNNCYHRSFGGAWPWPLRLPCYQFNWCMASAWPPSNDTDIQCRLRNLGTAQISRKNFLRTKNEHCEDMSRWITLHSWCTMWLRVRY